MYRSEDSDRSYKINKKDIKDNEHPRLAKRAEAALTTCLRGSYVSVSQPYAAFSRAT